MSEQGSLPSVFTADPALTDSVRALQRNHEALLRAMSPLLTAISQAPWLSHDIRLAALDIVKINDRHLLDLEVLQ